MQISFNLSHISSIFPKRFKPQIQPTSSLQRNFDVFIKNADNFIPFNKILPRKITKDWFKNLTPEEIIKYDNEFNSRLSIISLGEAKYFATYCKYLKEGLKQISKDKDFKFISIGQSPALFAKILELNNVNSAICPISELSRMTGNLSLKDLAKGADVYFDYLKNFNIDFTKIDKTKNYYFADLSVSGTSLKNFKTLLNQRGIDGENLHFISLDDIIKHAKIKEDDEKTINDIRQYYLYMQNLKNRYSPIFKLPVTRLNEIKSFEIMNTGCSNNTACNTLLYWLLKKEIKI